MLVSEIKGETKDVRVIGRAIKVSTSEAYFGPKDNVQVGHAKGTV